MRILFAALHNGYYRNIESVVEALAARGHDVFLGAERPDSALGGQVIVDRLSQAWPRVTAGPVARREQKTRFLATKARFALDYLRYLDPAYAETSGLLDRAAARTPTAILSLARRGWLASGAVRRRLSRLLDAVDRATPPSPDIERFLDARRPDAVIITPLIGLVASSQIDLLRSAQRRGIPTAVCVWSWDHLSSKAIIRDLPDRLFVWNHVQQQEAVGMHAIPAERVVVTGAQSFDRWFDRHPSRDRGSFARHVGLGDDRPYVLWVCSALFPHSPSEAAFVLRWAAHLRRSSDPRLREVGILIRPHPSRTKEWASLDWQSLGHVAFHGSNPIDEHARADYFDALHHSAAVVGLNTSAFIEAGIVGRPVLAVLPPEFHPNQEGTLHFRYLTTVGGGLLTTSRTLEEHETQLAAMLAGPPPEVMARQQAFVREFVRPHGLDVAATRVMADAIEALVPAAPAARTRQAARVGRIGLRLLGALERMPSGRRLLLDPREVEAKQRRAQDEGREVSWV